MRACCSRVSAEPACQSLGLEGYYFLENPMFNFSKKLNLGNHSGMNMNCLPYLNYSNLDFLIAR